MDQLILTIHRGLSYEVIGISGIVFVLKTAFSAAIRKLMCFVFIIAQERTIFKASGNDLFLFTKSGNPAPLRESTQKQILKCDLAASVSSFLLKSTFDRLILSWGVPLIRLDLL